MNFIFGGLKLPLKMEIGYRIANVDDYEGFYRIKCDPENVAWSGFEQAPNKKTFYEWFLRNRCNETRTIYLVTADEDIVGFFYLDKISDECYEAASSGILAEYCGRGIGTQTLIWRMQIAKKRGATQIVTWVSENNPASYKRLEHLGWQRLNIYIYIRTYL